MGDPEDPRKRVSFVIRAHTLPVELRQRATHTSLSLLCDNFAKATYLLPSSVWPETAGYRAAACDHFRASIQEALTMAMIKRILSPSPFPLTNPSHLSRLFTMVLEWGNPPSSSTRMQSQ